MVKVSIKEIAERLDFVPDETFVYLNKKTGEFFEVQREFMAIAEESEEGEDFSEYDDWEREEISLGVYVLDNWEDCVQLPGSQDIDEYKIMQRFCYSLEDDKLGNKFSDAIEGRGAFRRFRELLSRYDLQDDWERYKFDYICNFVREWCEFKEISVE